MSFQNQSYGQQQQQQQQSQDQQHYPESRELGYIPFDSSGEQIPTGPRNPTLKPNPSRIIPSSFTPNNNNNNNNNNSPAVRDKKVAPSLASGGIPDPSSDYLSLSLEPSSLLPYPRRMLLVLDLNGTLLFRPDIRRPKEFEPRPHAQRFLRYCIETFHVAIWSSARAPNVKAMINALVPEQRYRSRIVVTWSREDFGLSYDDYAKRVQCYKRLERLWGDPSVAGSHPLNILSNIRWSQLDTVLVDDSVEKARSQPHNLVEIPEFTGHEDREVPVLPQVHDYINTLSSQSNVSSYMRSNPFRLNPNYSISGGA